MRAPARRTSTSSHSPRTTTSQPSLRSAAPGVAEPCGPTATVRAAAIVQGVEEAPGRDQLGRGAAPEEVGGRGRHHGHVRLEVGGGLGQLAVGAAVELAVEHQDLMAGGAHQGGRIAELQRQVRRAAAEIDRALVPPGRIDQGDPHQAAPAVAVAFFLRDSRRAPARASRPAIARGRPRPRARA